jgi:hypothetical protein
MRARWLVIGVVAVSLACGGGGGRHGGRGGRDHDGGDVQTASPKPDEPLTGGPGSVPTPAPTTAPTPTPPAAPKPTAKAKDCDTPFEACKKTYEDAHWSCWTSCQYCGYCSDGLELSECDAICNGCRDVCNSAQDAGNSECEKQFYTCRDG